MDDAQLQELQAYKALVEKLHSGKETKREFERMVKKVNPHAVTTDDIAEPYVGEVKEEIKELRAWRDSMEKKIGDFNYNEQVRNLRSSGYTDDGIKAIEEIAKDRKVDLDMAAAFFDKTRPAPLTPNGMAGSAWNFGGLKDDKDSFDLLIKDEDTWQDQMIDKAMSEIQSARAR